MKLWIQNVATYFFLDHPVLLICVCVGHTGHVYPVYVWCCCRVHDSMTMGARVGRGHLPSPENVEKCFVL